MTRPASHNDEMRVCCASCKHAYRVPFQNDLLCCHGDSVVELIDDPPRRGIQFIAEINGIDVIAAEDDEYDRIWAGRVVDRSDVCSEWSEREESQ